MVYDIAFTKYTLRVVIMNFNLPRVVLEMERSETIV